MDVNSGKRDHESEWKKVEQEKSALLFNCLASVRASLWLLAGDQIEQAVIILHNSIELAFKAELAQIHPILISEQKFNYRNLKTLLKKEFESHPRGVSLNIPDLEIDRTINFSEAMKRVIELYPELIGKWESGIIRLQRARNNIVHSGARALDKSEYIYVIAVVAYPFLEEFLQEAQDISLKLIIRPSIYREVSVAAELCERLKDIDKKLSPYVFKTIRHSVFYTYVDWPRASEDILGLESGTSDMLLGEVAEMYIKREWANFNWMRVDCRICDNISTFVKLSNVSLAEQILTPIEVYCPHCGLKIAENEQLLAEVHIGKITEDSSEQFFLNYEPD
jgi:uncharacterized protein YlaI